MKNLEKYKIVLLIVFSIVIIGCVLYIIRPINDSTINIEFIEQEEFNLNSDIKPISLIKSHNVDDVTIPNVIDTSKPGTYKLTYIGFKDDKSKVFIKTIVIKDLDKPIFNNDNPTEITIKVDDINDASEFNITEYIKATDISEVVITTDISNINFNKPGTYTIVVNATDSYNNVNTCNIDIIIEPNDPIISNNKEEIIIDKPNVTIPNNNKKYFLFKDGYDINSSYSACIVEGNKYVNGYSCIPLKDKEGIYIGYELNYK